jgi:hypothetical protein
MVLPRMKRPAALPSAAPPEPETPLAAPQFTTTSESSLLRRLTAVGGAVLLLTLGAAAYQWMRGDKTAPTEASTLPGMQMGGAGWISEWASDAVGSARGRQISLYRPSIPMSDYHLEFLGRIERKSLGWVFRAADSRNYYAAKLEGAQPGPMTITRFAVIRSVEGLHIQRTLPLTVSGAGMLKVKLEARGPRFTVWVQNQVVEDWEDDRLKSGGVGFLNEREERGQVGSVQITFPKGGVQQ